MKIITNTGLASGFREFSEESKKLYNRFTVGSILGFLALIILATIFVIQLSSDDFDLSLSLLRLGTLSIISAPVTYFIKEASKHLRTANMYKKIELDLLAIDPFLEGLENREEAEAIKIELSKRIFGRLDLVETPKNSKDGKKDVSVSISNIDLVKNFIKDNKEVFSELLKK